MRKRELPQELKKKRKIVVEIKSLYIFLEKI